jgi:hypothetical protein
MNEVYFDIYRTSGGRVIAQLGYYIEYQNTPGAYSVNLHAPEGLSATDGQSNASASLRFGVAGTNYSSFNNFSQVTFQEAACVNGCPSPGFAIPTGAFSTDNSVVMLANTLYFLEMDILLGPQPTGIQVSGYIDPMFSSDFGGQFLFSPGVLASPAAVPGPIVGAGLPGLVMAFGVFLAWRRKRNGAALAA